MRKYSAFEKTPTAIVIWKYTDFVKAINSNCNVQVPCFQNSSQYSSCNANTLFAKGPPTAIVKLDKWG